MMIIINRYDDGNPKCQRAVAVVDCHWEL